jgi:hypothetical protein
MTERLHRPPAVPLVTFDPHTSIWSCADALTDDWPRHWTGTKMALYAVVRVDGVAWRLMGGAEWCARAATQVSLEVRATTSAYRFRCGPVEVALDFVTPLLADDLDLLSRPVTYLNFTARTLDGRAHQIDGYLDITGEIAVNLPHQRVFWDAHEADGITALSFRGEEQRILADVGDHRRIEWGTALLAGRTGRVVATVGDIDICRDSFRATGAASARGLKPAPRKTDYNSDAVLAMTFDLSVTAASIGQETLLIAYDDEWAVEYFGQRLRAWWRRFDNAGPLSLLADAFREQEDVLARAAAFDHDLAARARAVAGDGYADLLALSWRHTLAAHKLAAGPDGEPLYFSKENFSNGCIATVDVTYPSAPLFLLYNPALLRAMIVPYFTYCASPAWPFPFAAHDLGTYPKANGQTYRNFDKDPGQPIIETQMPVEECGNMLILVAALAAATGDLGDARAHWPLLSTWADYLATHGEDPGEQLCTDDFSGVLGHNVNLAAKATVGLACYARLAAAIGDADAATRYARIAKDFAASLLARARDGDATRLAFNRPGSWSMKYNMVWDRLLDLGLWPETEHRRELAVYRDRVELYGCPLDDRSTLTKPEWMLWAASLADDPALFADFTDRILRYANETPNRVPLSDLYVTDPGRKIGFQARSVLGGLFVGMLAAERHLLVDRARSADPA